MSKTVEFIKLLSVLLLCALIMGMLGYFIPKIAALAAPDEKTDTLNAPAIPQASIQTSDTYETQMAQSIQNMLEKITGPNTVQATVVVQMENQKEKIEKNLILPDSSIVKEYTSYGDPFSPVTTLTQEKTLYDYSRETRTHQKTGKIIKKQSITVIIDGHLTQTPAGIDLYQPRSHTEMATYTALVKSLTNFDAERGDTLEMVNLPFINQSSTTIFGFDRVLFVQSVLLTFFFIICVLILVRFILPMIYALMQPAPLCESLPRTVDVPSPVTGSFPSSKSHIISQIFEYNPQTALGQLKKWLYQQNAASSPLTGVQKCAILLLALGENITKQVFLKLKSNEVTQISRTMAGLGLIEGETVQNVFEDFLNALNGTAPIDGSHDFVQSLVTDTLPREKADEILKNIQMPASGKNVWQKLEQVESKILADYLSNEYPQTIAVILYHLSNEKAGSILNYFNEGLIMDVLMRLTALTQIDPETLNQVEKGIEQQIPILYAGKHIKTGKEKTSAILSLMDKKTDILNTLFERSPDIATQISSDVIMFEDIADWQDDAIRTLLEKTDRTQVVYALKGASDRIKEAFSRNMSPAVWGGILKETNKIRTLKLKDIDSAQYTIVKTAQELIEQQKITPHPAHE